MPAKSFYTIKNMGTVLNPPTRENLEMREREEEYLDPSWWRPTRGRMFPGVGEVAEAGWMADSGSRGAAGGASPGRGGGWEGVLVGGECCETTPHPDPL